MVAKKIRCLTSFRWFVEAHADEMPAELIEAICGKTEIKKLSNEELLARIQGLNCYAIWQLCAAIERAPRSYFGTFSTREFIACLEEGC